jgi:hypothetical protein
LSHSPQTVRNLIARGALECFRCPGIRVSETQLSAYLDRTKRKAESSRKPTRQLSQKPIEHLDRDRLRESWRKQGVE